MKNSIIRSIVAAVALVSFGFGSSAFAQTTVTNTYQSPVTGNWVQEVTTTTTSVTTVAPPAPAPVAQPAVATPTVYVPRTPAGVTPVGQCVTPAPVQGAVVQQAAPVEYRQGFVDRVLRGSDQKLVNRGNFYAANGVKVEETSYGVALFRHGLTKPVTWDKTKTTYGQN